MLSFSDSRWQGLTGGYRIPLDIPALLQKLESSGGRSEVWDEIWQELLHQGDVGEGSYLAVPHLVRIYRQGEQVDWNVYALVAAIELARDSSHNPSIPDWASDDYFAALQELARLAMNELPAAGDSEAVRSMLAVVAISLGARTYGRLLATFTEDEVLELEKTAFGEP